MVFSLISPDSIITQQVSLARKSKILKILKYVVKVYYKMETLTNANFL